MPQPRSSIVATAILAEVVTSSTSRWFTGPIGWRLTERRPLVEPVWCKGAQGLWKVPKPLVQLVLDRQAPLEGALDA